MKIDCTAILNNSDIVASLEIARSGKQKATAILETKIFATLATKAISISSIPPMVLIFFNFSFDAKCSSSHLALNLMIYSWPFILSHPSIIYVLTMGKNK
uniref:Uncharacterized protein n=1 Tax=Arundo donax TaxID=35708 RepID=A0A0A9ARQ3_ARUDO